MASSKLPHADAKRNSGLCWSLIPRAHDNFVTCKTGRKCPGPNVTTNDQPKETGKCPKAVMGSNPNVVYRMEGWGRGLVCRNHCSHMACYWAWASAPMPLTHPCQSSLRR